MVQLLVVVIIIGGTYHLWQTAKTFGGLIGDGLKWIGLGIVFFSLEALDRVLGNFSFVATISFAQPELIHNLILLAGLAFSAYGFSRLTKVTK